MTQKNKKIIDYIVMGIFHIILCFPVFILYGISYLIYTTTQCLFDKFLTPIGYKLCKIIRGPIPNSSVNVKGAGDRYFKRINEKLLTIKEAKKLGKQYEDDGYEVQLHLSEL